MEVGFEVVDVDEAVRGEGEATVGVVGILVVAVVQSD